MQYLARNGMFAYQAFRTYCSKNTTIEGCRTSLADAQIHSAENRYYLPSANYFLRYAILVELGRYQLWMTIFTTKWSFA
jgi:hypothetical protein